MNNSRVAALTSPLALVATAAASFAVAMALARAGVPEFSHRVHPLALRGAHGLPGALAFNVAAFLAPGLLLAWAGRALMQRLPGAGAIGRIGWTLAQLSALAFALMGVFPLDQAGTDATGTRLHALMWMLWWIAFVPAALSLAVALRRRPGFALACLLSGALVPVLAVLAPIGLWVGLAQRVAFSCWLAWWLLAAAFSRAAVSSPGSPPPGRT